MSLIYTVVQNKQKTHSKLDISLDNDVSVSLCTELNAWQLSD